MRSAKSQGGGAHGNAIMSKYKIKEENTEIFKHKYQPVNWDKEGYSRKEPRKGDRYCICTCIEINPLFFIDVYCVHSEVFCGTTGRIQQFSDVPLMAYKRKQRFINEYNDKNSLK